MPYQRNKLTDDDLLTALERLESSAELADESETERLTALGRYRGENLRPAPEGRSQVTDRTVWEVVESVKPQLLKLFLSGDEVVRFEPRGPEDIQGAAQESAAVNFVITQKNPAFHLFSGWAHDGLLHRVGYVKAYVEQADEIERETYRGLTEDEFALIAQDSEVEIIEQSIAPDLYGNVAIDLVVQRKASNTFVRIVNVPPESVLVHSDHADVSLAKCAFVQHRTRKTISELREAGFDVDDDINDNAYEREDFIDDYRREFTDMTASEEGEEADPSMRTVLVRESWVRLDKDGDGIASLYHTVVIGKTLLLCEDADHVPIIAWCPIPQPHMHRGYSLHDEVKEIQDIKQALVRSVLDNLYLSNNGRFAVDPSRVSLDDFLVSRPGGIVRTEGDPAGAIMPLFSPFNPAPAMQMAEYMDVQRELRTGIPRVQQGQLDPLSQNKTATGISQVFAAGQQRIELIARYFAEGVKELCAVVHRLLSQHSKKAIVLAIQQEFVAVDPRQWAKRTDLSISVGLGSGNRFEQTQFLQQILALMFGPAGPLGLTDPGKVYNALAKLTTAVGFKNPEEFWNNPRNAAPPAPPPPDPKLVEVQQNAQIEQAKMQLDAQSEQARVAIERERLAMDRYKADLDAQIRLYIEQLKAGVAQEQVRQQSAIEGERLSMDSQRFARDMQREDAVEVERESGDAKVDALTQATQDIIAGLQMLQQQIGEVSMATAAPREVVRDPQTGRVVGIKVGNTVRQVARDSAGRVTGIQ